MLFGRSTQSVSVTFGKQPFDVKKDVCERIAVEEPLSLSVRYHDDKKSQVLTIAMRTPGHDQELGAGFLYSEGLINSANDIENFSQVSQTACCFDLGESAWRPEAGLTRHFVTSSSCGSCGKTDVAALIPKRLQQKLEEKNSINDVPVCFSMEWIRRCVAQMADYQTLFRATGGTHATGFFLKDQMDPVLFEDVGRHNAFDKAIGQILFAKQTEAAKSALAVVSGRLSFELVQKAAMLGIPCIAAIGAPSSLAVTMANDFGIVLLGFVRGDRYTVYTYADRILDQEIGSPPSSLEEGRIF